LDLARDVPLPARADQPAYTAPTTAARLSGRAKAKSGSSAMLIRPPARRDAPPPSRSHPPADGSSRPAARHRNSELPSPRPAAPRSREALAAGRAAMLERQGVHIGEVPPPPPGAPRAPAPQQIPPSPLRGMVRPWHLWIGGALLLGMVLGTA